MGETTKIPSNHRQAERLLIAKVQSGEWSIDSDGRVWRHRLHTGRVLTKPRRAEKCLTSGYFMVRATIGNKRVVGCAHRLVWQSINGDIPDGQVINHRNGRKGDNRPANLEVATYSENQIHARRVLGVAPQYGHHNPMSKLTVADVADIRLARGKERAVVVAERFGIRFQHVYRLWKGQRWPHLQAPAREVVSGS